VLAEIRAQASDGCIFDVRPIRTAPRASALADWEQGRRSPDKAARVLLTVIAHNHQAVLAALAAAKRRAGD
jgi:hypothetical protein